jgi:hypothetical protein
MNNKINVGIILPHLGASQLTEEVLNSISDGKNRYVLYYENLANPYRPIPYMNTNITETVHFKGRLIATTLFSASYILSNLNYTEKIFYIYELEWLKGRRDFLENLKTYRNQDIKLYTRSEEYSKLIGNYCNRKVEVKEIKELV